MKTLSKITLLGVAGIFLPMMASAEDVMTIVGGQVGILTATPTAPLDVNIGTATPGPGNSVLRLQRDGAIGFQMQDSLDADGPTRFWQFGNANSGSEFRINKSGVPGVEMTLNKNGNLTISGELTTAGSCSIGCDRVFDGDYELPTIEEHAQQMWVNRHLPNVGPTEENGPFNVSDKLGRMLNELETAHIYIDQLNGEKQELHRKVDTLESRLGELEALLSR